MATASDSLQEAILAAERLRHALTDVSDALESGSLSGLLDAELTLDSAVSSLVSARQRLGFDRTLAGRAAGVDRLRAELNGARTAMTRCTVLGAVLDDFVRGRCQTTYTASGAGVTTRVRGTIEERV